MALRELITGSDICTPGDGAGPSNAAGALADTLLGRGAKNQEQLRDLPGISGNGAGPSVYGAPQAPSVSDFARAAAEGGSYGIPGTAGGSAAFAEADANAFMFGQGAQRQQQQQQQQRWQQQQQRWLQQGAQYADEFAAMEEAYREGVQRPPTPFPHQMLLNGDRGALQPFLQAFVESGRLRSDFRPMPAAGVALTVADQCRVRDRSTIMARHLYADLGDEFADTQVSKLLQSLNIDPRALPAVLPGRGSWDHIYNQGIGPEPMQSMDLVAAGRAASMQRPEDRWAQEFQGLGLRDQHQRLPPGANDWGMQFAQQQMPSAKGEAWAEDFQQQQMPGGAWASEFNSHQAAVVQSRAATDTAGATLAQTKALAETLAADPNPKVQNSQFLQFLSKMSRGELIMEDNQVKPGVATKSGTAWAGEFSAEQPAGQQWAHEFNANPAQQWMGEFSLEQANGDVGRWADDFANGMSGDAANWGEQFNAEAGAWIDECGRETSGNAGLSGAALQQPRTRQEGYVFAADNPFMGDTGSFGMGKDLFRRGVLSEAVLALEAEVQRAPRNVDAWRLLGTVHAENDDDVQAIAAMDRALEADPGNLEVLLSLGVSHTNELDQSEALSYLHRWLTQHPAHGARAATTAGPPDSSQRHSYVVGLFEAASRAAPGDADVLAALGVLHNLGRTYESAVAAFRAGLKTKPQDYSLWNKLGATLANSARSAEAITAYQRALELKPNYMRAWTNMGISQANVGQYDLSARYYIRALGLNPRSDNVWGYLRTALSCAGRIDLLRAVDAQDLGVLEKELSLS